MIVYVIGILPIIKNLKREIPDIPQPWYAYNYVALGTFSKIETYFNSLTHKGLERGYHPEPSQIVLIVNPENLEAGKVFGKHHRFKVCMVTRYLGCYIEYNDSKHD